MNFRSISVPIFSSASADSVCAFSSRPPQGRAHALLTPCACGHRRKRWDRLIHRYVYPRIAQSANHNQNYGSIHLNHPLPASVARSEMLEDAMKLKVRHLWLMLIVAAVLLLIAVAIHTASA